jgi:hypothetical protein
MSGVSYGKIFAVYHSARNTGKVGQEKKEHGKDAKRNEARKAHGKEPKKNMAKKTTRQRSLGTHGKGPKHGKEEDTWPEQRPQTGPS